MARVTNLFQSMPGEAQLSYAYYLSRLAANDRHRRVVTASELIRRQAAALGRPRLADFTYDFEIEALCRLGRWQAAWRQLRRVERIDFGRPIDLQASTWSLRELYRLRYRYAPILYFLGRYRLAGRVLEAVLATSLKLGKRGMSYQLLPFVYNRVPRPRHWHEVTLHHVYRRLGKGLLGWADWRDFVTGFDARVLRLACLSRRQLLGDPSLLRRLAEAIAASQKERLTSGVSWGERDLTDPLPRVRRRQQRVARKTKSFARALADRERRVEELFPDLRGLRPLSKLRRE